MGYIRNSGETFIYSIKTDTLPRDESKYLAQRRPFWQAVATRHAFLNRLRLFLISQIFPDGKINRAASLRQAKKTLSNYKINITRSTRDKTNLGPCENALTCQSTNLSASPVRKQRLPFKLIL